MIRPLILQILKTGNFVMAAGDNRQILMSAIHEYNGMVARSGRPVTDMVTSKDIREVMENEQQ